MWTHKQTFYFKPIGQKQCPLTLRCAIREIINLATPTNGNDASKKSYVGGVKEEAALVFVPVYFFNYEMAHDNEKETKFLKSRSKYGVFNDRHYTLYSVKLTFDMDGTCEFHQRYGCKGSTTHF